MKKNPLLEESKNFELGRIVIRTHKPRKSTKKSQAIIVYVRGGVAEVEKSKKYIDVPVEVHDYDIDDDDSDNIAIDEHGERFARSRY